MAHSPSRRKKEKRGPTVSSGRRQRSRHDVRELSREQVSNSPPSYSVEENSQGEWPSRPQVNSRLNVKWPQQVDNYDISKHRYVNQEKDQDSSRRTKRKERREKEKEALRRDKSKKRSRKRSPSTSSTEKDDQYISLSIGSEREKSAERARRKSKRNVIQTSPQRSRRSNSAYTTDEDARAIDSVVFDTRSELIRYRNNDNILPSRGKRGGRGSSGPGLEAEREEFSRFYLGVRSRRSVEKKLTRKGEFAIYYEKPRDGELPVSIDLHLAYLSSGMRTYHFPIHCFEGADHDKHYVVMQNKNDGKMFPSILALVKHYYVYSHVDPTTGRLDAFSVPH